MAALAFLVPLAALLISADPGIPSPAENSVPSISGLVVDADGKGIAGARVVAIEQFFDPDAKLTPLCSLGWVPDRRETVARSDGSFRLQGLNFHLCYTVQAIAPGFSPAEKRNLHAPREGVEVRLGPGSVLAGVVCDSTGRPVERARVEAYQNLSGSLFDLMEGTERPSLDAVSSGSSGAVRFLTLGKGTYDFCITAPGHRERWIEKVEVTAGENGEHRFMIEPGLRISGTVVSPDCKPVAEALVRVRYPDGEKKRRVLHRKVDVLVTDGVPTDNKGAFLLDTLDDGKHRMVVTHPSYVTAVQEISSGTEGVQIRLGRGWMVSGQVREAGTDRPIPGVQVLAYDVVPGLQKVAVTSKDGMYWIRGLRTGKTSLRLRHAGYAPISPREVEGEEGRDREGLVFEMERTATVRGRVVDSQGNGVPGAMVMVHQVPRQTETGTQGELVPEVIIGLETTDSSGKFTFEDLPTGESIQLSVHTQAYPDEETQPYPLHPGEALAISDIVLGVKKPPENDGSP